MFRWKVFSTPFSFIGFTCPWVIIIMKQGWNGIVTYMVHPRKKGENEMKTVEKQLTFEISCIHCLR